MKLDLQLYVRRHRNGFFTVRVLGDRTLEIYTHDLDQAREDLELVVGDLVERSHPRRQNAFAPTVVSKAHIVEIPDLISVHASGGTEMMPAEFAALVSSGQGWQNVWLPRLDLHVFIKNRREPWEEEAAELIEKHFQRLTEGQQLDLRLDAEEWIEVFQVEAQPPPLTKFVGPYRDLDELPLPADEEETAAKTAPGDKPPRPPTPTLTKIGVNLAERARAGELERAHERKDLIDELQALISGHRRQAIAVVGPSGVGKTTLLNELAYRVAYEKEDPKEARPVFFVDASRLVAGENWFGDWQRQTLDVTEECDASDVVWFVGNLLPLLDAGKNVTSDQNVAMLLKPALAGQRITIVGECTPAVWSQLSLRDAGFARLFSVFRVEEPAAEEAGQILQGVAKDQESEHGLKIADDALNATIELARRYTSDISHLGAAAHLLRRVAEAAAANDVKTVQRSEVIRHFCTETGLPDFLVRDELPLRAKDITGAFRNRLIGQEHAIDLMTNLVTVIKSGLSDLGRPLGSFLFVGPTGVGKTETAKTLASFLFGSANRLTRFDMSEFAGWDAVPRFLGTKEHEGKLVSAVRRRPFSVVLLDEIEKASPAIFDVLLQVLGEARLTDEGGRTADFKNVVLIMTSNLGVDTLKRGLGFEPTSLDDQYRAHFLAEAQKFFRPELFNRIDHIVPFMPLGPEAIGEITKREIDKFLLREGLRQRDQSVTVDHTIVSWLSDRGIDERYGARPLKRVLERELTSPLAHELASGVPPMANHIRIGVRGDVLGFVFGEGKRPAGDDRRPLETLVRQVQDLRFRHRCWSNTAAFRETRQRLRLLDRLSQSKNFWDDKALAEERLIGSDTDRQMVTAFDELGQRIGTFDDLVHDAYFARDVSALNDLRNERSDLIKDLGEQELNLHARGLPVSNAATLYLVPGTNAERLLERLIVAYAELSQAKEWQFSVNLVRLVEKEDAAPSQKSAAHKEEATPSKKAKGRRSKNQPEDAPADEPKPAKPNKKKAAKVLEPRYAWGSAKFLDLTEEHKSVRHQVGDLLASSWQDETVALFIEGPHASTMLTEETGHHLLVSNDRQSSVSVRAWPRIHRLTPTLDMLQGALVKHRLIDERRNIIEDFLLGLHFPLEPRIWRVYSRFMHARPFKKAFGDEGIAWYRAWEAD